MAFVNHLSLPHFPTHKPLSFFHTTKTHILKNPKSIPTFTTHSSLSLSRKIESFSILAATETQEAELVEELGEEGTRTRILAQNVPWSSSVDDIRPLFERFGIVVDIELSMFNKTRNRGLAFVTMGSHEEALAALTNLESFEFEGRTLKLAWAKPKKKKEPSIFPPKVAPIHNLFVANLPFKARDNDLKEFFNSVSAEIIFYENPRRSAGYGFVSFYSKEEADAALSAFNGKEFMGREIRVDQSKRFLRQGTKESIEAAELESTKSSIDTEQSE